jgi:hypothetical protein
MLMCARFEFDNDSEKWVSIKGDPIIPDDVDGDTFWEVAEVAIEMYIFSQTYDIPRFRQDAMDRLVWSHDVGYDVDYFDTFVSASCIKRAYDHTEEGSPLRKWLIIGFMEFCSYDKTEMNDYPHQYLIDISNNYKQLELDREGNPSRALHIGFMCCRGCFFHEHDSEQDRTDCKVRVHMERKIED